MQPIDVVCRFIIEYQTGRHRAAALELLAPDFIDHTPFPGFGPERESVLALFNMLWMAFPDLTPEILEQLAQDDRVATRKVFRGTHRGEFLGMAPTGKAVAIQVIDIVRIQDSRISEHWNVVDAASLIRQLQS
ncbi:MAG: ester cyclase [Acidobacteria bacterium]|nr:ester cyclase [Acidobacteriota bacterium]